ncbi:MerR family transcriptional regulator [Sphaerisporangium rubeum]|uniref:DNA-binding transcriptional MerR regulator n=1 Tax=Sphaerisporangium rubeum TaxID=321317 RepID=A0A7X0M524_9ACTN|nr:MerR family transcriptional regulator [Sphaerisporangium rubeum]MBB6472233.1 DNA-binding transcriptional MerR regulator [Sphaerisporangium rubeum]
MRIGEVAEKSGVSVRSLRYYEEQSLITSTRTPGGQRQYDAPVVPRVHLIQQLYAAGLASRTIRQILPCIDSGKITPALLKGLTAERTRINRQITDLLTARARLDDLIATAERPGPGCTRVDA